MGESLVYGKDNSFSVAGFSKQNKLDPIGFKVLRK